MTFLDVKVKALHRKLGSWQVGSIHPKHCNVNSRDRPLSLAGTAGPNLNFLDVWKTWPKGDMEESRHAPVRSRYMTTPPTDLSCWTILFILFWGTLWLENWPFISSSMLERNDAVKLPEFPAICLITGSKFDSRIKQHPILLINPMPRTRIKSGTLGDGFCGVLIFGERNTQQDPHSDLPVVKHGNGNSNHDRWFSR